VHGVAVPLGVSGGWLDMQRPPAERIALAPARVIEVASPLRAATLPQARHNRLVSEPYDRNHDGTRVAAR
jgi:hypothetical protein